jgi:two-component system cell cycle sensor histidine kinase/response regulator CckA
VRVLVVDDDAINRKLLRVTLAGAGHEVVEAVDGIEALKTLRSGGFDAVISDVLMPGMDGYRLCLEMRRSEGLKDILFIIYTSTYTSPSDERLASSVGADKFLTKPAPAQEILDALEEAKSTEHPGRKPRQPLPELEVLKEYSEGLVRKLEHKNIELEASERRYRELVAQAPIGIHRSTRDGRFVSVNFAFARLLGYESPEEVLRLDLRRDIYFHEADRERLIGELEPKAGLGSFEVRLKRRDGSAVWVRQETRAIRGESGEVEFFEDFVLDVDERRSAELKLRQSEERFRRAFTVSPVATSLSESGSGRLIDVNGRFLRLLGYTREEVIGRTSLELDIWADPSERQRIADGLRTGTPIREREVRLRTKTGGIRHVLGAIETLAVGEETAFLSVFQDITERKQSEEALRASEERYRFLFESNPQPMWVFDEKTLAFLAVNDAACKHYQYSREEILGLTIEDIRPVEDIGALHRLLETEPREYGKSGVWRHRKKDGTVIEVEISWNPLVFDGRQAQLVLATDVTERRSLEQQLRQAQKMEAIGQLAGGVAHDFNNLLTVILGFTELAAAEVETGSRQSEPLGEIRKAGERAAVLTRQLLAFSRRQVLEPKILDLNALITDLERMLRRLIGEDVELATALDPGVGPVRADVGQIEQVILNLAVNARDAMPTGGKLTIETRNVELDESYAREHVAVRPGSYAMLAVTDTGTGMSAETKSHMFEPFFTTKGQGKGTGLGLATVYGIVKQSEGNIWVYSELGRGATFKIYLPLVKSDSSPVEARPSDARPARGSETVLLVEDEDAVRTLTRRILEGFGYSILEARKGEAALELARRHSQPIHLLLTDVVMPDMGGPELAERMRRVRPDTKVLFMSGYTDDAVVRHGIIANGVHFLQKPFTPEALARKVRETLDHPQ